MKKEMESMVGFDVLSEGLVETLSEHELPHAISSRWVKTRKPDGTVRCRLVVRGFDQTFASTASLTTLHSAGMFQPETFPQLFCMP